MTTNRTNRGASTRCVHDGHWHDPSGAVATPITLSSTFEYPSVNAMEERLKAGNDIHFYTRYGNPSQRAVEQRLAALEGTQDALVTASGMAAITTALLSELSQGDRLACMTAVYGGTLAAVEKLLPRFGIEHTWIDPADPAAAIGAIPGDAKVVFLECPTNPHGWVPDIAAVAGRAHGIGAVVMIDTTFATPINLNATTLGADVILHSCSKYLGGHSDVIAGAIASTEERIAHYRETMIILGGCLSPASAYLLERGMLTLGLRMARHNENGLGVARFLRSHPAVRNVYFPGLSSHPHHELAQRQMSGFGAVLSFELDGGTEAAARFLNAVEIATLAVSLGGVETLATAPAMTSHRWMSREQREAIGVPDGLIRLAMGIEDTEDLIAEFDRCLRHAMEG